MKNNKDDEQQINLHNNMKLHEELFLILFKTLSRTDFLPKLFQSRSINRDGDDVAHSMHMIL